MELDPKKWIYGGALILALVSGTIGIAGMPSMLFPMPVHLLVVAWLTLVLFPFVTPTLYILITAFAEKSKHFAKIVLALIILFGLLNFFYINASWEYGLTYQGLEHTKVVTAENIVGFGLALSLCVAAILRGSRFLVFCSNFILFFLLSWCAFPYLGELP